jgi:hypothetical protein
MPNKTAFSALGLGVGQIVDIASLSLNARYKMVRIPLYFTLVASTNHNLGALGIRGKVVAAFISNRTVGTYTAATVKVRNGTQATDLTNTLDPSTIATGGANTSFTQTAAMQALVNAATDQLQLVDNGGTFTGSPVEGVLVLIVDPVETASVINQ